jgi:hypothetical protein
MKKYSPPRSTLNVSKILGLAMVLLLSALMAWIFLWKSRPPAESLPSTPVRSLAVLPVENLSSYSEGR